MAISLSADGLSEGEYNRRLDLLSNIKNEIGKLGVLARDTSRSSVGTLGPSELRARASASARNELLGIMPSNNDYRSNRKFGVAPPETERTRMLDSQGLLRLQKEEMAVQDHVVESLSEVVKRQKEIAGAISNEIDEHNVLLEQIDEAVERVTSRTKVAEKKVDRILKG